MSSFQNRSGNKLMMVKSKNDTSINSPQMERMRPQLHIENGEESSRFLYSNKPQLPSLKLEHDASSGKRGGSPFQRIITGLYRDKRLDTNRKNVFRQSWNPLSPQKPL